MSTRWRPGPFLALLAALAIATRISGSTNQPGLAPTQQAKQPSLTGTVVSPGAGKPISGARIEILRQVDSESARERLARQEFRSDPLAHAISDSHGRFSVAVMPGVPLLVVAEAPGHARSRLPRSVIASAAMTDWDLGSLELPPGGRLSGKVVSDADKPISGATVIAMVPRSPAQRRGAGGGFARALMDTGRMLPQPVVVTTAPDGTFTLDSVPEKDVTLRAYAEGLAPARMEKVRVSSSPQTITLRLSAGHPVTGKVVAPDGKTPVSGAWVLAGDQGWDGITRAGGDGSFTLPRLRAGVASIRATSDRIMVRTAGALFDPPKEGSAMHAPSAPTKVTLPIAHKGDKLTLRLRAGGLVHARVLDAETREPVPDAVLWVMAPGEDVPRRTSAGARGEVIFTGVPAGRLSLSASASAYLDQNLDPAPLAIGQTRSWIPALKAAAALEGTVRDATGRPVSGARVSVSTPAPFARGTGLSIFVPLDIEPVTSDTAGRFVLEKLPPKEELKIGVASEGFAPWEMSAVKLKPGERLKGMEVLLDAGLILSGRLVGQDGAAVAGGRVTASRRSEEGGPVIRIASARAGGRPGPGPSRLPGLGGETSLLPVLSDKDGVFRVRGAKPGIWTLEVQSHGHAPKSVGGLKLEESARALDAGEITLEPGASLKGRVVTAAGEPIPSVRGAIRKEFDVLTEFTSDAGGNFIVPDLIPGEPVTLTLDADGFGALEKGGLAPPLENLEIVLAPSSRVMGSVLDQSTRRPIPDFSISVSRSRGGGTGAMAVAMTIAGPEIPFQTEDGTFVVEDVDPGKAAVAARAPGYRDSVMRDLEIPEGGDLGGLVFTLDRSAIVSGTVSDDRGRPLSGASVEKKAASGPGGRLAIRVGRSEAVITDGEGSFLLEGLDRGPMTLSFTHPEFETADVDVDATKDVEGLRVKLSRGVTLTGVVVHEDDGSPVPRASVTAAAVGADRLSGARTTTSGQDGSFVLEAVGTGRYTLRAEAVGLRPAVIEDLVVSPGSEIPPLELRMGGGVTLAGQIAGVKEADLPRFTVRVIPTAGGGFGAAAPVDSTGRFEIKGLSAGTVTLMADSGLFEGKAAARTVQIPEGVAVFETIIEFPRGHTVSGVVSRGGQPVDGASVIFTHAASRTRSTATSDTSGQYVAEDLDSGEYDLSVLQMVRGISHTLKTSVSSDRDLDIELPLKRVSGFVRDAGSGQPLDGASIAFRKEGAQQASGPGIRIQQESRTDTTGYYAIEGLDDGSYILTARKDGYGFESRPIVIVPSAQPDEVSFDLVPADSFLFRAMDTVSGRPIRSIEALVLAGGGDPLTAPAATAVFRGNLQSDASGQFHLDSLRPGSYRLVLGGQGVATETIHEIIVPGRETSITMGPGGSVEVSVEGLEPGQTARGVLLDGQGRPAHFNALMPEPTFQVRPASPTRLSDMKPGDYRLRVSLPTGGVAEKPLQVVARGTARVSVP